jgi:pimeloyl-ACP methyl ester carboxylesterase
MSYPIVKITTPDNLILFGLLTDSREKKTILINIHGTGSGFYIEEFEENFAETLPKFGIATLFTNNRGNFVMEMWQKTGGAVEKFEDCLIDIDTWIEKTLSLGYEDIILQGHSLGTEKIVYYMEKGKYRDKVRAVILLGFSDSFGTLKEYLKTIEINPMEEAKRLVSEGKPEQFIANPWRSHSGYLPKGAESYINFFSENSELSKAIPLRYGKNLTYYQNIKVPILGVIGDQHEFTIIPIKEAIELLKKENKNAEVYQIKNCNHSFEYKTKELVNIVSDFLKRRNIIK